MSTENAKQSLDALERMINYCEKGFCRRQNILEYFGEKIDARTVCNKTCDYCSNPSQIEKQIQLSHVIKDVSKQSSMTKLKFGSGNKNGWDGQWNGHPGHSDDENDWGDRFERFEDDGFLSGWCWK